MSKDIARESYLNPKHFLKTIFPLMIKELNITPSDWNLFCTKFLDSIDNTALHLAYREKCRLKLIGRGGY
ncbi:hypothetical protein [Coxiella-like endosymbiont]|uniref:hypothetical protein n=1 Tax=Coxiella-like endosymbiont TaxID=1592897 RepID=UPI00272BEF8D|nr:hypothetical protein [Coxiella-like endosymbiont]